MMNIKLSPASMIGVLPMALKSLLWVSASKWESMGNQSVKWVARGSEKKDYLDQSQEAI
jgi:hypothetical protein